MGTINDEDESTTIVEGVRCMVCNAEVTGNDDHDKEPSLTLPLLTTESRMLVLCRQE